MTAPLLLASASTIRLALLRDAGLTVEARPSPIDEDAIKRSLPRDDPGAGALALAAAKAAPFANGDIGRDRWVIGADQILCAGGTWFDKPRDPGQARDQLRRLRGRTHTLHSAVVCRRGMEIGFSHVAQARLTMADFDDAFLERYLALEAGHVCHSVGAYRLEGPGIQLFAAVEGDHATILGLPLLPLLLFLRDVGISL